MTTQTEAAVTTQAYRVYIEASPEAIWDAITKPEWTERYGYKKASAYPRAPPELTCSDVAALGIPLPVTVVGDDPHGLDPDGDGHGCD